MTKQKIRSLHQNKNWEAIRSLAQEEDVKHPSKPDLDILSMILTALGKHKPNIAPISYIIKQPKEIIIRIILNMGPKAALNFCATNKSINAFCSDIWEKMSIQKYNIDRLLFGKSYRAQIITFIKNPKTPYLALAFGKVFYQRVPRYNNPRRWAMDIISYEYDFVQAVGWTLTSEKKNTKTARIYTRLIKSVSEEEQEKIVQNPDLIEKDIPKPPKNPAKRNNGYGLFALYVSGLEDKTLYMGVTMGYGSLAFPLRPMSVSTKDLEYELSGGMQYPRR